MLDPLHLWDPCRAGQVLLECAAARGIWKLGVYGVAAKVGLVLLRMLLR